MIKIIFFDIDGTLRPFETGKVPEKTKDAIRMAREAGILTCIATGRHWLELELEDLIEGLPFDAFVTLDGNYCYTLPAGSGDQQHEKIFSPDGSVSDLPEPREKELRFDVSRHITDCYFDPLRGSILHNNPIPPSQIQELMRFLEEKPFPIIFEEERNIYVNFVNDDLVRSFEEIHSVVPPVGNPKRALEQPIFMLIPIMPYEASLELAERLPECQVVRWSDGLSFDMTPKGISKVTGIDRILSHYGINRAEAAAIGDGLNDIEMLQHVGMGIAMGNAKEPCKKVADYVAPHILEDGLYHAVLQIISRNRG